MYASDGTAIVLPEGSIPPQSRLPEAAEHEILIRGRAGAWEYLVQYPDGFLKQHQGADVPALCAKIMGVLRNRYGVKEFQFKAIPKAIEAGEKIIIGEVKYVS